MTGDDSSEPVESGDGEATPGCDSEALDAIGEQAAANSRDVEALEEQVTTLRAALAELLDQRQAELEARAEQGLDDVQEATDSPEDHAESEEPRWYW